MAVVGGTVVVVVPAIVVVVVGGDVVEVASTAAVRVVSEVVLAPVHQTNDNPPTSRPPITTTRTLERRVTEPGHTIAGWPVPGGSANLRLLGVATTPSSLKFECPLVLERVRGHSDTVEPEVRGSRCVGPQRWSGGRVRGFG